MTVTSTGTLTVTAPCCPQCGFGLSLPPFEETQTALLKAQQQIADLEAQVRLLNQKASAAVDRWADYEDEVARLRAQLESQSRQQATTPPVKQQQPQQQPTSLPTPPSSTAGAGGPLPSPTRASFLLASTTSAATRISALLSSRTSKSTPNPKPLPPGGGGTGPSIKQAPPPPPRSPIPSVPSSATYPPTVTAEGSLSLSPPASLTGSGSGSGSGSGQLSTEDLLLEALTREQALRREAEGRLSATSREVEELSVSLFEQANEMVASERRARAKLEERVEVLERRELDKRRRLERLESAVGRIERVRGLLREGGGK